MSPLHGLSFGFRLVVVTPRLISGDDAVQKLVTFSLKLVQQVLTDFHSMSFVVLCKHPRDPPGTNFAIIQLPQHRFQCITADIKPCTQFPGYYLPICTDELIEALFIVRSVR